MKTLITAEDIRKLHRDGGVKLDFAMQSMIITPEARDVASKLGISIVDTPQTDGISAKDPKQAIREAVEARLPAGKCDPALLEQLVNKALRELAQGAIGPYCERDVSDSGIVLVKGGSVRFGRFDGAPGKNIGLTDVIGSEDGSSIGAGFMQWENSTFPWTLNYDEIDVVLEGELHITCGGKTSIGKPGDVFFIPKGSSIEFGTPSKVRFVYISYPADWSDA